MADYQKALELYRKNYLEYKTTGESTYKIAYQNAETWIKLYLEKLQKRVDDDSTYVDKFLEDYERSNPEMMEMQKKMKIIQDKAPKLQQQYETEKLATQPPPPPDMTSFYIRGGVIAGVLGVMAALSFF